MSKKNRLFCFLMWYKNAWAILLFVLSIVLLSCSSGSSGGSSGDGDSDSACCTNGGDPTDNNNGDGGSGGNQENPDGGTGGNQETPDGNNDNVVSIEKCDPDTYTIGAAGVPSRTSGKAPLYVFFDASKEFTDESYLKSTVHWNFDLCNNDSQGRHEVTSGFSTGHVYEKPGVYIARANFYDTDNKLSHSKVYEISVEAWGDDAIYVSSEGDDENSGSIDAPIATVKEALLNRAKAGRKILFKNGDTFEISERMVTKTEGPILVSSYSDPSDPSEEKPLILAVRSEDGEFHFEEMIQQRGSDWRYANLHFKSSGEEDSPRGINMYSGDYTCNQTLMIDLVIEGVPRSLYFTGDQNAVFDSEFHTIGTYGIYGSTANQVSVVGTKIYDVGYIKNEHVIRFQTLNGAFIAYNHLQATHTKSCLQIRGNSSHVVIYANVLDRGSGINPQNGDWFEYIHHCVFDSNFVIGRTSPDWGTDHPLTMTALNVQARDIVIRNNIFYNYSRPVSMSEHVKVGVAERIHLIHNTFVANNAVFMKPFTAGNSLVNNIQYTADDNGLFIKHHPDSDGNNAAFSPDCEIDYNMVWGSGEYSFLVTGGDGWLSLDQWRSLSGYDQNSQSVDPKFKSVSLVEAVTEDPDFTIYDLEDSSLFALDSTSLAIDSGTTSGAVLDFFGNKRDASPDLGAIEYSK